MKKRNTKVSTRPLIIDQSHLASVLSIENWPLLEREREGVLFHCFTFTFSLFSLSLSLFHFNFFTFTFFHFHFHYFTFTVSLSLFHSQQKTGHCQREREGVLFQSWTNLLHHNAHLLLFAARAKKRGGPNGTQKPFNLSTVPHWPILQFPHSHSHSHSTFPHYHSHSTFPHSHSHSTFPHSHSHSHSTFPQRPILQWKSSIILIAHCLIGNLDFWWFLVVSGVSTEYSLSF